MCILLAVTPRGRDDELWIAANRDERLDRSWAPPRLLRDDPPVFGGRDLVGGGSWLAVSLGAGFVVGVTNARLGAKPGARSRGQLVLDLAAEATLVDAVALLGELDLTQYGAFNVLVTDVSGCWLATNAPAPALRKARARAVALGNDPLERPGARVVAAARRAAALAGRDDEGLREGLRTLLADHRGEDPLCRHGERYGTVCSTILALRGSRVTRYLFAPGRPCTTAFERLSVPSQGGA